ncbi:MAG: hypothetical protein JWM99_702 [Verrucomicrobiales bacterium]|nr:hypothetical protein [Verrucomicrobiales bacterium]
MIVTCLDGASDFIEEFTNRLIRIQTAIRSKSAQREQLERVLRNQNLNELSAYPLLDDSPQKPGSSPHYDFHL